MDNIILSAKEKPFTDKDAAQYKANIMTDEIGEYFSVVPHPEGGYGIIRGEQDSALAQSTGIKETLHSEFDEDNLLVKAVSDAIESDSQDDDVFLNLSTNKISVPDDLLDKPMSLGAGYGVPPKENYADTIMTQSIETNETLDDDVDEPLTGQNRNIDENVEEKDPGSKKKSKSQFTPLDEETLYEEEWIEKYPPISMKPSLASFMSVYMLSAVLAALWISPKIIWGQFLTNNDVLYGPYFFTVIPKAIALTAAMAFIYNMLHVAFVWLANSYLISNREVEHKYGIVSRKKDNISVQDMVGIKMKQTAMGRIFNYGTIELSTAASSGSEVNFVNISNPVEIEKTIKKRKKAAIQYAKLIDK